MQSIVKNGGLRAAVLLVVLLVHCKAEMPRDDHAVYTAVARAHFLQPEHGAHGMACERETANDPLTIAGRTQPLPPGNPRRDSGWANALPAPAAPLMAALRALDDQPRRNVDAGKLAVGVPVQLVATEPRFGPLFWFSRVAYTADGKWALLYAVKMCPGATEADAANAEPGSYVTAFLAPLERQGGAWTVRDPLYLAVGLPRLEPARPR